MGKKVHIHPATNHLKVSLLHKIATETHFCMSQCFTFQVKLGSLKSKK